MISFAKIYFQGVRGGGFTGDIGIDDIKLKDCRTYLAQGKQTVVSYVSSQQKNTSAQGCNIALLVLYACFAQYQSSTGLSAPVDDKLSLPALELHAGLSEIMETFGISRKLAIFHYLSWSVGFILKKILFFTGKSTNKFSVFFLYPQLIRYFQPVSLA